jgi:hypothetical protein
VISAHAPVPPHIARLVALLLSGDLRAASQPRIFDVLTASIADMQAAVEAGALTYERLVQMYLSRSRSSPSAARPSSTGRRPAAISWR